MNEVWLKELAVKALRGNAPAFSQLIARHEPVMLAIAFAITRCAATASDCVQDACLSCWQKRNQCTEPERFGAWLATSVRRRAIDARRAQLRASRHQRQWAMSRSSDQPQGDSLVESAIALLDARSAQVLTLRYWQQLSSREIGALLEISPASVDMRLSRARSKLKALLEEEVMR